MKRSNVRPSVCLSVCLSVSLSHRWPAGLLLSAPRAEDIDRLLPAPAPRSSRSKYAVARRSAANAAVSCTRVDRWRWQPGVSDTLDHGDKF